MDVIIPLPHQTCGWKPVQVLATLFLLSYAKIIRVVITVFSYTVLVYPNGFSRKVWLYDGTVELLRGNIQFCLFLVFSSIIIHLHYLAFSGFNSFPITVLYFGYTD